MGAVHCPSCGYAYTKAVHAQSHDHAFRRNRKCLKCNEGFVTYEILASDWAILMELRRWNAARKLPADV